MVWTCIHFIGRTVIVADVEILRRGFDWLVQEVNALNVVNPGRQDGIAFFFVGNKIIPIIAPDHRIRGNRVHMPVPMGYRLHIGHGVVNHLVLDFALCNNGTIDVISHIHVPAYCIFN